jgi:hypothetical protein
MTALPGGLTHPLTDHGVIAGPVGLRAVPGRRAERDLIGA